MLELVGVVFFVTAILRILYAVPGVFSHKRTVKETWQTTILLTGATDGIGKAFASYLHDLASTVRIVLHGRDRNKLDEVRKELRSQVCGQSEMTSRQSILEILQYDLSDKEHYDDRLIPAIREIQPDTLINCAGISYPSALYFHELPLEFVDRMITVNLLSALVTTCAVLKNRKGRGTVNQRSGTVLFIGSAASVMAEPLLTLYSATKAALNGFGHGLQNDNYNTGLAVQVQVPLMVTTKISKIRNPSFFVPSTKTYVRAAADGARYAASESVQNNMSVVVSPYKPHYFLLCLVKCLPKYFVERLRLFVNHFLKS